MARIIHPWAGRTVIFNDAQHKAIGSPGGEDYAAHPKTQVIAAADGTLVYVGGPYNTLQLHVKGSRLVIEYKENLKIFGLAIGQQKQVKLGDVIALTGLVRQGEVKAPHLDVNDGGEVGPITPHITPPVQHVDAAILASGATLAVGDTLTSGQYTLTCQADGNLVLYRKIGKVSKALWQSKSFRPGTYYTMQTDGNFVGYYLSKGKRKVAWKITSLTLRHAPGSHLSVQGSDGNIVVYAPNGKAMWSRK
jgi:murein DD-endopeptidase MepM/ murein hydrolase activator NlpD